MILDDFLRKNRIDYTCWEASKLEWSVLCEIAEDHNEQADKLRDTADLFARTIQRFSGVHSVRWRIKDVDHLLEKIIRKCAKGEEKYIGINASNYFEIVTDLVGVRALHLFKSDCFEIDEYLKGTWGFVESPIAYVRNGDPDVLTSQFVDKGFEVKPHPVGYRSIHYVCSTQPLQRKVFVEIQVRTIFEEGWSEIDHRVRYPNFSDNELVAYFLTIFNRLAGSADEMGTFVQELTSELDDLGQRILEESKQKEDVLSVMKKTLDDLENTKKQDAETKIKLATLQEEVDKLKNMGSVKQRASEEMNLSALRRTGAGSMADALKALQEFAARESYERSRLAKQGMTLNLNEPPLGGMVKKDIGDK